MGTASDTFGGIYLKIFRVGFDNFASTDSPESKGLIVFLKQHTITTKIANVILEVPPSKKNTEKLLYS